MSEQQVFGDNTTLGDWATLGNWAKLGDGATLGDGAKLGDDATLGDWATLGNWAKLGDGATLGDGAKVGKRFSCEGVKVIRMMNMGNVDGSGRRVNIYVHTEGILIRAGCFKGSLEEFCAKAESEGKSIYSAVVRAAATALSDQVKALGLTGGWDEATK